MWGSRTRWRTRRRLCGRTLIRVLPLALSLLLLLGLLLKQIQLLLSCDGLRLGRARILLALIRRLLAVDRAHLLLLRLMLLLIARRGVALQRPLLGLLSLLNLPRGLRKNAGGEEGEDDQSESRARQFFISKHKHLRYLLSV